MITSEDVLKAVKQSFDKEQVLFNDFVQNQAILSKDYKEQCQVAKDVAANVLEELFDDYSSDAYTLLNIVNLPFVLSLLDNDSSLLDGFIGKLINWLFPGFTMKLMCSAFKLNLAKYQQYNPRDVMQAYPRAVFLFGLLILTQEHEKTKDKIRKALEDCI